MELNFCKKSLHGFILGLITIMMFSIMLPVMVYASEDVISKPQITCRAHVQKEGWMNWINTQSSETLTEKEPADAMFVGTRWQAKRMEALQIVVPEGITLKYRAHVQKEGWMDWVDAQKVQVSGEPAEGTYAGTMYQSKRMEAFQIAVEGLNGYELWYRAHSQGYGWMNWVKAGDFSMVTTEEPTDGNFAGTRWQGKRMEALQIVLVPTEHITHIFGDWEITKQATCVESGEKIRKCSICNKVETEIIPANGVHTIIQLPDEEATCQKFGRTNITQCTVCKQEWFRYVPQLKEHRYEKVEIEPTCTENGKIVYACTMCGLIDNSVKEEAGKPALGHIYTQENEGYTIDKKATCTENGSKSKHCTRCGNISDVTEIPMLNHEYVGKKDGIEATCETYGRTETMQCIYCGVEIPSKIIPKKNHEWQYIAPTAATPCKNSFKRKQCLICQKIQTTQEIDKVGAGHTWNEQGKCTVCGESIPKGTSSLCIVYFVTDIEKSQPYQNGSNIIYTCYRAEVYEKGHITVEAPKPKNGYQFDGWYDKATGVKVDDSKLTENGAIKVEAKDFEKTYEARYR